MTNYSSLLRLVLNFFNLNSKAPPLATFQALALTCMSLAALITTSLSKLFTKLSTVCFSSAKELGGPS